MVTLHPVSTPGEMITITTILFYGSMILFNCLCMKDTEKAFPNSVNKPSQ